MGKSTTEAAPIRALKILELLFQRVLDGFPVKEIADVLGYSPSNVCRDLDILQQAGWARRLESGRWAVTEKPAALLQVYNLYMEDLSRRRDQFTARVQAKAKQYL